MGNCTNRSRRHTGDDCPKLTVQSEVGLLEEDGPDSSGNLTMDLAEFEFPFENVVFEDFSLNGIACCGAMQVLEDINMASHLKRVAGSGGGSVIAALFCLGYTSREIATVITNHSGNLLLDHRSGFLSLLMNLESKFGWNSGIKLYRKLGDLFRTKTGNPDVTFLQIYKKFKKELCVVVTNLNLMNAEYCHPKTTPNLPVRLACRMSLSAPGVYTATKHSTDFFIDGGMLVSYPVACFDGWWLSMDPQDSFLQKLLPLTNLPEKCQNSSRFGKFNDKTLGFILFDDQEDDIMAIEMKQKLTGVPPLDCPNTKLFRKNEKKMKKETLTADEYRELKTAYDSFFRVLSQHDLDKRGRVSLAELKAVLKSNDTFSQHDHEVLFGKRTSAEKVFRMLDTDDSGQIDFRDLICFLEKKGIYLQERFHGYRRKEIKNFGSFLRSLQSTLLITLKRVHTKENDKDRTIGIYTAYIGSKDFSLEEEDVNFLLKQGRQAARVFLQAYVEKNPGKFRARPERGGPAI